MRDETKKIQDYLFPNAEKLSERAKLRIKLDQIYKHFRVLCEEQEQTTEVMLDVVTRVIKRHNAGKDVTKQIEQLRKLRKSYLRLEKAIKKLRKMGEQTDEQLRHTPIRVDFPMMPLPFPLLDPEKMKHIMDETMKEMRNGHGIFQHLRSNPHPDDQILNESEITIDDIDDKPSDHAN